MGFDQDIAGIGRDDASCLAQLQSRNESTTALLTIGLGSIAADIASNTNSFASDDAFLVWGHNGLSAAETSTVSVTLGIVTERMARIWRVDENASTVGNTQIQFDLTGLGYIGNLSDYQLIISSASDPNSPTIVPASTKSGDLVTFNDIDFTDGQYFGWVQKERAVNLPEQKRLPCG